MYYIKRFLVFAVFVMATLVVISCDKKEEEQDTPKEETIVKEEPKDIAVEEEVVQEVIPVKEEKIVFENGSSLAKLYPDSWKEKAQELGIPILDEYGEVTTNYNQKVYSYVFPGDYIKEGQVYDKNDKLVDFQARLSWRNSHRY